MPIEYDEEYNKLCPKCHKQTGGLNFRKLKVECTNCDFSMNLNKFVSAPYLYGAYDSEGNVRIINGQRLDLPLKNIDKEKLEEGLKQYKRNDNGD